MFSNSLFQGKKLSENIKKDKNRETETKKCLKCLRRVSIDYERCPYCWGIYFQYKNE